MQDEIQQQKAGAADGAPRAWNMDAVIKIVVVALIALFFGAAILVLAKPKANAAAQAGGARQATQSQTGQPPAQAQAGGAQRAGQSQNAGVAQQPSGGGSGVAQQTPVAQQSPGARAAQNPAAVTVSALTMERGVIRQTARLNGDVTPQTEVGIFPDTAGKIARLVKSVGDSVVRGEVIGYIDPSRAGVAYEQNPIVSTVGGTLTALPVSQGETITTATRVATIGSLGNLKITIYVAEKYSAFLRRGLPAVVSFAAAPGEQFEASVATVSPVLNSANRTVEAALALAKNDPRIKPGMYANVDLVIREAANAFVLPKAAVKNYNNTLVVYKIDENNVARRVQVTTGLSNDSHIEIVSGIAEGDRIVTAGAVTDGSPVRIAGQFTPGEGGGASSQGAAPAGGQVISGGGGVRMGGGG